MAIRSFPRRPGAALTPAAQLEAAISSGRTTALGRRDHERRYVCVRQRRRTARSALAGSMSVTSWYNRSALAAAMKIAEQLTAAALYM
jgi:hypothetical protein